jgi:membrane protein YqaA with SNARE-associated domain
MASPVLTLFRQIPTSRRRSRRLAVIAAFTGIPLQFVGYETLVAPGRLSTPIWGPITVALFGASLIGALATYAFGQGRMGDRSKLDERQRAMNDRALVVSYGVVTTVVTLVLGAIWMVASFVGPITIQMDATSLSVAVAVGLYLPLLPFASLAWIEPDAPADDVA